MFPNSKPRPHKIHRAWEWGSILWKLVQEWGCDFGKVSDLGKGSDFRKVNDLGKASSFGKVSDLKKAHYFEKVSNLEKATYFLPDKLKALTYHFICSHSFTDLPVEFFAHIISLFINQTAWAELANFNTLSFYVLSSQVWAVLQSHGLNISQYCPHGWLMNRNNLVQEQLS